MSCLLLPSSKAEHFAPYCEFHRIRVPKSTHSAIAVAFLKIKIFTDDCRSVVLKAEKQNVTNSSHPFPRCVRSLPHIPASIIAAVIGNADERFVAFIAAIMPIVFAFVKKQAFAIHFR